MIFPRVDFTQIVNDASQGIYRPEAYGTPTGTDDTVDAPLVQAAIDAAAAAAGGTIRLDQTYAFKERGGSTTTGPYHVDYVFWINESNIVIDGNSTGILKLTGIPTNKGVVILVGNGGYPHDTTNPGWETLEATGTWIENITIKNLSFDNSGLADNELDNASSSIYFAFVKNSLIDNITIDKGGGGTDGGAITTGCSSILNTVSNCHITLADYKGIWLDGAEDSTVDSCVIDGFAQASSTVGIVLQANLDYYHNVSDCTIQNCEIYLACIGIAACGMRETVQDNTITLLDDNVTHAGIYIQPYATVNGIGLSDNSTITGNTVTKANVVSGKGWGVWLAGVLNNAYDGTNLGVLGTTITGNTLGPTIAYGLALGSYVNNTVYQHNTLNCTASVDVSGGTAYSNTLGPNP